MSRVKHTTFKPGRKSKSRRELAQTKYVLVYSVDGGPDRRKTLFRDREASEAEARKIIERVERQAAGIATTDEEGLRRPLLELLKDYERAMLHDGASDRYVRQKSNRIRRVLDGANAKFVGQLETVSVQSWLQSQGFSRKTVQHYTAGILEFVRWLRECLKLPERPLVSLRRPKVKEQDQRRRRRLSMSEVERLVRHLEPDDAAQTWLCVGTGARHGESRLSWRDLDLDRAQATFTKTKNGNRAVVDLPLWVVDILKGHQAAARLAGKYSPDAPVFPRSQNRLQWRLREAAARAGLGQVRRRYGTSSGGHRYLKGVDWIDPRGLVLDVHCLRGTFCAAVFAATSDIREIQRLCRHSDIRVTAKHYAAWQAEAGEASAVVRSFPDPRTKPATPRGHSIGHLPSDPRGHRLALLGSDAIHPNDGTDMNRAVSGTGCPSETQRVPEGNGGGGGNRTRSLSDVRRCEQTQTPKPSGKSPHRSLLGPGEPGRNDAGAPLTWKGDGAPAKAEEHPKGTPNDGQSNRPEGDTP